MRNERKDFIVVGAALFAMFFGAGNLIFPSALGLLAGDNWLLSMFGFLLTGVGLPILGIITVSKAGGTINDLAEKVSPIFSKVLGTIIILAIGPLLAIPRTGATVYEIGIKPIFSGINPLIVSIIYFSITLFFVIKPSGIIDKIGKILTPILLFVISSIILKGIFYPIGTPINTGITGSFSKGFINGYQTMDALGSIVLGGIVLISLKEKGYSNKKDQIRLTLKAGLFAGTGLALVYGGLLFLGATSSNIFDASITKTELIIAITNNILGSLGQIGMGIAVSAACLTTSIGLTAVVGNYFEDLTKGKLNYKTTVICTVIFSTIISVVGVEQIVKFSVPLLVLVYPVAIILIIMNLFDYYIKNKNVYKGAVFGAILISSFDALAALNIKISFINELISFLPFSSAGFAWVIPAIISAILVGILTNQNNSEVVPQSKYIPRFLKS